MLKITEIKALAKVTGVSVYATQWANKVWEAAVLNGNRAVICVGRPAHTKKTAMNKAWDKYIEENKV